MVLQKRFVSPEQITYKEMVLFTEKIDASSLNRQGNKKRRESLKRAWKAYGRQTVRFFRPVQSWNHSRWTAWTLRDPEDNSEERGGRQ